MIAMLGVSVPSIAINVSPATRLRLSNDSAAKVASRDGEERAPYQPLILQLDADTTASILADSGIIVYNHRHDIYLTSVPTEKLDFVLGLDGVLNAATSGKVDCCMDLARDFAMVDAVHSGSAPLASNYDGTGVVVGFSDIGFDAQHIAFKDKVARIYDYDTRYGIVKSAVTPDEISEWTTDTSENYHATHVGNILAGSYIENGYYGTAPGAELVATTSGLDDVGILAGVEQIISYAKEQGKPAVINLSLSTALGPRDGTDLMDRYLSYCAEDAIICISAGNKGDIDCYAAQRLDHGIAEVATISFRSIEYTKGYVDVWSDSSEPFEYCIGAYDCDLNRAVYTSEWLTLDDDLFVMNEAYDPEFAKYFTGEIMCASEISPLNGRHNATAYFNVTSTVKSDRGAWQKYFGYIAARQPESSSKPIMVHFFADASELIFSRIPSGTEVYGSQGSINNLCCADGVISVGMANSRNVIPIFGQEPAIESFATGTINVNSSYSAGVGLPELPHFSAPGSYIVSAMSGEYYCGHPDTEVSDVTELDGKEYYWFPALGTSMSSPFAAGVIATWLQANSSLTPQQVIDIAQSTALTDYTDITDPRWGAGCINAYAGLCEALSLNGLPMVERPVSISITADRRINAVGLDMTTLRLYNLYGMPVDISSALTPGIYILHMPGYEACKLMVR